MLTGKQKSYLRGLANTEKSMFQIGKDNISENLIESVDEYLKAHELCKVNLLKTAELEVREAALLLASETRSEVVQLIGRTIVLFRKERDGKIILPR